MQMRVNKEDAVSAFVMTIVSALVLIGFTVAWYTKSYATVTNMQMVAAEMGGIKVALESGEEAKDVSELAESGIYADIDIDKLLNVDGKMAPGAFGKVTFYVTPMDNTVTLCNVVPATAIKQGEAEWYFEKYGEDVNSEPKNITDLYNLVQAHIEFFADEAMTIKIDKNNPLEIAWSDQELMTEKETNIYWQWHYEYPFTVDESNSLSKEEKKELIKQYDLEDIQIGQNISDMRFHFDFLIK